MTGRAAPALLASPLRAAFGPVAALAALVVAVLGFRYAGESGPGEVEARVRAEFEGAGSPWRQLAVATDFLGEPAGAAALIAAAVTGCLLLRWFRAAVLTVAGTGLAVGATTLLKHLVGRTINGGYLSYPSGHTAFATALALAVTLPAAGRLGLGRTAGPLLVFAAALAGGAAMGWAQVALGAHYPTDALGGWCTALAVTPATALLIDRAAGRRAIRTDRAAPPGPR
ncbi:phosphatase PAP2 family protein [Streptomyces sp. WMMB303]|uniref:phosphatase PAP2 family protein n=1 Tax=Streptomyces sp. WMMB303 TaxID=3034154 RepID=UPI0023EAE5AF|nr:phosphatase PAP2 family protein [Streptomyces sp. WMMB303]MDF4252053.1 phosphatase PAP2 family protein [Streptomyces sp. WMMB303]